MALVGVLAYPLPRNVGDVEAVIRTEAVGDRAFVEVQLEPADAADDATAFAVTSWQGGGRETSFFDEVGPGLYRSEDSVPVTGRWKSIVSLQRGDELMAAPVYLPDDPEISAVAVPLAAERRVAFVRNTDLLLREQHDGPTWPAVAVWTGFFAFVALWTGLFALTAQRVSPRGGSGDGVAAGRRRRNLSSRRSAPARLSTRWSCGAAWSARRPVKAEVASSNLVRTARRQQAGRVG